MSHDRPSRPLAISPVPPARERALRVFGSVPWALRGAYVTLRPRFNDEGARSLEVRAIRFQSGRRVTYHEQRLVLEPLAANAAAHEPRLEAEAHRGARGLLVNVPQHGCFTLDAELALLALRRSSLAERALFDAVASARGASAATLTIGASKLVLQRDSGAALEFALAAPACDIRQFAATAGHLTVIARSARDANGRAAQLGVAALDAAVERRLRWFPIELAPVHQLLGAVRRGPWLWLSIADRQDARASRIRSLGVHLQQLELRVGASHEIEAHGPFAVEFVGSEPIGLYGLGTRPEHAEHSALVRLDLRNGRSSLADGAFGTRLGAPALAYETGESPRASRPWLLLPTYDAVPDRAELTIREGSEPERAPVALVRLPGGFAVSSHGVWI